ncbi:sugar phosphate nucleotidyltransferase [Paenibacillus abyssi]|uniref:Mannose-1-phosphate guanylyltransferase n=1 Tax=Paenibacillus abyssi TaxID=1340531 RepID=A0A917LF45_9BACL|nr:sugar phosphate nucleotidyltransferase [Paenibacillus abyssi]GGG17033.1 mannose-1-phosphate guanylyltransferase [Paenibacillus abyssi]
MRIVLLSGGSGKRLWPLSNEIRSKIFMKVLPTAEGINESMIQRVCRQLKEVGLDSSSLIVTHKSQVDITIHHVGSQMPIIAEPSKRGTFHAVALTAAYLHSRLQTDPRETICFIPVDLFAETAFIERFLRFPAVLQQSQAELALLGTRPTFPSDQYGYIVPAADNGAEYYRVEQFAEKPDVNKALALINQNALWNCGIFAFPLSFMLSWLDKKGLPVVYEEMLSRYEHLSEVSFDKEVVEQSRHAVVMPYDGFWNDLGSWEALVQQLESPVIGSGTISEDSINTHLVNELAVPVHVVDVPNIIVASSNDGILVASKKSSNRIKEILPKTRPKPMYVEKRWGSSRVLDHSGENGQDIAALTKKIEMLPGQNLSYQQHQKRKEVWVVLSGIGEIMLDGKLSPVQPGDIFQISSGTKHGIKAVTPLVIIEVQIGTDLTEDDILRFSMTWEDTLKYCIKS